MQDPVEQREDLSLHPKSYGIALKNFKSKGDMTKFDFIFPNHWLPL